MNAIANAIASAMQPITAGTNVSVNGCGPLNSPQCSPKPQTITANAYGR